MIDRKSLILVVFLLFSTAVYSLEADIREEPSDEYADMISINDREGGHVAEPGYYDKNVSVQGTLGFAIRESCRDDESFILGLYDRENSHATTFENEYNHQVCSRDVESTVRSSCQANETAAVSLYQSNNTHVAEPGELDDQVCLTRQTPENVSLSLSGDFEEVYADGDQLSTDETRSEPVSNPYIASVQDNYVSGIVGYSNFLEMSRTEERITMVQEPGATFLVPHTTGDESSIERRQEEVVETSLLGFVEPNFAFTLGETPTIRVSYTYPELETEDNFATSGTISSRNLDPDEEPVPVELGFQ